MAPLVTSLYTADPSAHSFQVDGKQRLFVYPSHDIDAHIPFNDRGDQYAMRDYRILEMEDVGKPVKIHDVALDLDHVPWASKQMWAPDCAQGRDGRYYLFFPARNRKGQSPLYDPVECLSTQGCHVLKIILILS